MLFGCAEDECFVMQLDEENIVKVEIGVKVVPEERKLNELMGEVEAFCKRCEKRVMIVIRHIETDELVPPELPAMISMVKKIVDLKDLVEKKCAGVVIRGKYVDDRAKTAMDIFEKLYNPPFYLKMVSSEEELDKIISKIKRGLSRIDDCD
jgi:hypothetical protein